MAFDAAPSDQKQEFVIKDAATINKIGKQTDKVLINFYNATNNNVDITLDIEYGNEPGFARYGVYTLTPGMSVVSLNNLNAVQWSFVKSIERIRITVSDKGAPAFDGLYIADMSIYMI